MKKDIRREYRKQREQMHEDYLRSELNKNDNFTQEERDILFQLLSKMKYGVNRIKEILTNIREISKRDNISIKILVEELKENENSEEKNIKQKAEEIRKYIFKRRFPETSKMRNSWQEIISTLNLPKGLFIEPPHNFEGDHIIINIKASNNDDYEKCVKKLEEIKPEINKLIDFLH